MKNYLKDDSGNNWKTLPEICMFLRMHISGASDPLDDEDYKRGIGYVRGRVQAWSVSQNAFDAAVLSLCIATLAEADRGAERFGAAKAD